MSGRFVWAISIACAALAGCSVGEEYDPAWEQARELRLQDIKRSNLDRDRPFARLNRYKIENRRRGRDAGAGPYVTEEKIKRDEDETAKPPVEEKTLNP